MTSGWYDLSTSYHQLLTEGRHFAAFANAQGWPPQLSRFDLAVLQLACSVLYKALLMETVDSGMIGAWIYASLQPCPWFYSKHPVNSCFISWIHGKLSQHSTSGTSWIAADIYSNDGILPIWVFFFRFPPLGAGLFRDSFQKLYLSLRLPQQIMAEPTCMHGHL